MMMMTTRWALNPASGVIHQNRVTVYHYCSVQKKVGGVEGKNRVGTKNGEWVGKRKKQKKNERLKGDSSTSYYYYRGMNYISW